MYAVIVKPEIELPTVISEQSQYFPDFIMSGYEIVFEGTKRDCVEVETEMLQNLCINY